MGAASNLGGDPMANTTRKMPVWLAALVLAVLVVASIVAGAAAHRYGLQTRLMAPFFKPTTGAETEESRGVVLLREMKAGNLIFYFRHATRDKVPQQLAYDLIDIAGKEELAPACLNAAGKQEAELTGRLFAYAQIPVGTVVSSPSCRAKQSATLAFKKIDIINPAFLHSIAVSLPRAKYRDQLYDALVALPITPGTNTVVFSHTNTINQIRERLADSAANFGKTQFKETGFYVLRRTGKTLSVLGLFSNINALARSLVLAQAADGP